MFKVATGWLGWSPEVALNTPIPQIELALEGRIEWVRKTNPFCGGEAEPEAQASSGSEGLRAKLKAMARKG